MSAISKSSMAHKSRIPDKKTLSGRMGLHLTKLRETAGLSVADAADAITAAGYEVNRVSIHRWENGDHMPSLAAFPAIAKTYKLASIRDILPAK